MPEQRWIRRAAGPSTILVLLLASWASFPGVVAESPGADGSESSPRAHADPREVQRAFVDALDALLANEPKRAKLALDRVAKASPPLMPEMAKHLGKTVVGSDNSFQKLLNLAREVANQGDNAFAFRYHQGLQRTCIQCHDYARQDGVFVRSGD